MPIFVSSLKYCSIFALHYIPKLISTLDQLYIKIQNHESCLWAYLCIYTFSSCISNVAEKSFIKRHGFEIVYTPKSTGSIIILNWFFSQPSADKNAFVTRLIAITAVNAHNWFSLLFIMISSATAMPKKSHFRCFAVKSQLKSHQMITCFVQNDDEFNQMIVISIKLLF